MNRPGQILMVRPALAALTILQFSLAFWPSPPAASGQDANTIKRYGFGDANAPGQYGIGDVKAPRQYGGGDANAPENRDQGGQSLSGANGDMFMEEVVPDHRQAKPKPRPIPIDLSRVGVSVDPHGNIVPLKDSPYDPWAATGVKPIYSNLQTGTELPYGYPTPYWGGIPIGTYPLYGSGIGYGNIGLGGLIGSLAGRTYGFAGYPGSAYPGYGFGRPGYPGFGPGLFGNPAFGFPGYGYPGFSYSGYGYGGYSPLGFGGYPGPGYFAFPGQPSGGFLPFGMGNLPAGVSANLTGGAPALGAPIAPLFQSAPAAGGLSLPVSPAVPTLAPGHWLSPGLGSFHTNMWRSLGI